MLPVTKRLQRRGTKGNETDGDLGANRSLARSLTSCRINRGRGESGKCFSLSLLLLSLSGLYRIRKEKRLHVLVFFFFFFFFFFCVECVAYRSIQSAFKKRRRINLKCLLRWWLKMTKTNKFKIYKMINFWMIVNKMSRSLKKFFNLLKGCLIFWAVKEGVEFRDLKAVRLWGLVCLARRLINLNN